MPVRNLLMALALGIGIGLLSLYSPWLGLAAVAAIVFVIAGLNQPMVLAYTMVAATVLTSGMMRGSLIPLLRPNEAALVLVAGLTAPSILLGKRKAESTHQTVDLATVLFIAGMILLPTAIYLLRGINLGMDDVMVLVAPVQYLLLYIVFQYLPQSEEDRRKIIHLMLIGGSLVALIGLLQAIHLPFIDSFLQTWYPSSHLEDAQAYGRVTSIVSGWNVFGILMMIVLIMVRSLYISGTKLKQWERINIWITTALCGAALLASGSFAGAIGLGIGILIIGRFDDQNFQRIILIGIVLGLAAFLLRSVITDRLAFQYREGNSIIPQTLTYRFDLWRLIFIPAIRENGLWGLRPDFAAVVDWGYAESQYFYLLLRSGVVSLLGHLLWVGLLLLWLFNQIRHSQGFTRSLQLSAFTILIVMSIAGLTNSVFSFSGATDYLWILLGLIASQERITT